MKKPILGRILTIGMSSALALEAIGADWDWYRSNEARVKAIAANPEAMGDQELQFLMAHLYYPDAITAITKAKTSAAQAALWRIALEGGNGSHTAAYTLVKRMTNKLEALKLLDSSSPEVHAIALRGLLGSHGIGPVSLDREAWEVVRGVLNSENLELRQAATRVTALDSGTAVPVAEKAKAIAESMATTVSLKGAEKMTRYDDFVLDYSCLLGEDVLARQAIALGWMKGVTGEMLAVLTPAEPGLARDGMVIARTIAGDLTMRGELHRIVTNSPSGRLRMAALDQALNWRTVTEADRVCLEAVAAADPLQGSPGKEYAHFTGDRGFDDKENPKIYPARILAERSLRILDARKQPPATGP